MILVLVNKEKKKGGTGAPVNKPGGEGVGEDQLNTVIRQRKNGQGKKKTKSYLYVNERNFQLTLGKRGEVKETTSKV